MEDVCNAADYMPASAEALDANAKVGRDIMQAWSRPTIRVYRIKRQSAYKEFTQETALQSNSGWKSTVLVCVVMPTRHGPLLPTAAIAAVLGVFYWRNRKQRKEQGLRPQNWFHQVLADNSDRPFEHLQTEELDDSLLPVHPFQQRILNLKSTPPTALSRHTDMPASIVQSTCKWIASVSDLQALVQSLQSIEMLAVDVEHHHLHSYLGFVCLLQLSTGKTDYLVDALALHDHMHLLRPIFADPSVLKVVHGGDNDVLWLQRDYHIYMVNVFDTEKACQALGRHQRSLAKLLDKYCQVTTDKSFQKSDWRVRPLSKAQQAYAQRDAHYLLYLAHVLYQELEAKDTLGSSQKDKSRVMQAWDKCQRVSLNLYHKPQSQASVAAATATVLRNHVASPADLADIAMKLPGRDLHQVVTDCVHALCQWRDDVARDKDEGLQAVLPDAVLMALAAARPSTPPALISCAQGSLDAMHRDCDQQQKGPAATPSHVSVWLRRHASGVAKLLADAATGGGSSQYDAPGKAASGNANQARQLQTPEQRQAAQKARLVKKFSAKSAVYENCKMLSQEGELLCFCDLRKLTWYENRGLADRISADPPTIKLRFMHKTGDQERGVDDYYLHSKENKCVSCGETGHYLRYRVVPACYRRNFPVQWKSHRSHDIVLLCVDCHHVAHRAAEVVKRQLSQQYGVPLFPPKVKPEAIGGKVSEAHPYNVRRAAVALKQHGNALPEHRRKELQQMVRGFVRQSDEPADDEEWLSQGASTSIQQLSRQRQGVSSQGVSDDDTNGHAWHGRQVVAAALAEGGSDSLLVLIQKFRQSFTDALHPKFLPSAWHIMHSADRDFGEHSIYASSSTM
ncbi:hypothetical protein WJX79_008401 [Trebouxia sp. C0005]